MNSIELDGDAIVFSARHLDAVYRIRLADGGVDWKLGGSVRPESLAILDDPDGATSLEASTMPASWRTARSRCTTMARAALARHERSATASTA